MRVRRTVVAIVAPLMIVGAGCSIGDDSSEGGSSKDSPTAASSQGGGKPSQRAATVLAGNKPDHAEADDGTWQESEVVDIRLTGGSATVDGEGVKVDGATVTINNAGTYRLRGTLNDGQVLINAPDDTVKLILDGAAISSSSSAAIAATEAEKVIVILADGSRNTLADARSYGAGAAVNAAMFSAADLTITGTGALAVQGNGNDAIASTDGLVVSSGTITVNAADDGIRGKDYLVVRGGTIGVTAGGDGLKADNTEDADSGYISVTRGTVKVTAKGDGLDAATDLVVTGGAVTVASGGGSGVAPRDEVSAKGLKSAVVTVLAGGTITVDSSDDGVHGDAAVHLDGADTTVASGDDGVHAERSLTIDAGTLKITSSVEGIESADIKVGGGNINVVAGDDAVNAAGGTDGGGGFGGGEEVGDYSLVVTGGTMVVRGGADGFDSNGNITISGGTVVTTGPSQGFSGAIDVNGSLTIKGGVVLAAGSAETPGTGSGQGWLSAVFDSPVTADTTLHIVDSDKKVLATFTTSQTIQTLLFSSSVIKNGEEYQIYVGGKASGTRVGGLASSGDLASAERTQTITAGEAPAGGRFGRGPRG